MSVILIVILWGIVWESTTISSSRGSPFVNTKQQKPVEKQDWPKANIAGDISDHDEEQGVNADECGDYNYIENEKYFSECNSSTTESSKGETHNSETETDQTGTITAVKRNKKSDRETTICNNPQCNCTQEQVATCKCDEANKVLDVHGGKETVNITELQVKDCNYVTVGKNALSKIKDLKKVTLENITKITIQSDAFYLTHRIESEILFRSSGVCLSQQKSFRGFRGTLTFENVTFQCPISNGCFQSLNITSFVIKKSQLNTISKSSFNNCKISTFELSESKISDRFDNTIHFLADYVLVKKNEIGSINGKNNRRGMDAGSYVFLNNDVRNVYEKAFILNKINHVIIKGNVFHYVQFESFDTSQSTNRTFTFTDNEFKDYEKRAIIGSRETDIGDLKLSDKCGCNMDTEKYLFSNDQNKNVSSLLCLNEDGKHVRIQEYQKMKNCEQIADATNVSGTGPCRRSRYENGKLKVICQCKGPNTQGLDLHKFDDEGMKTEELNISGCERVVLRTDLLTNLTAIETLTISLVKEITIEQRGIFVPFSAQGRQKMKIHIESSSIFAKSEAFGGFLGELHFHNVSFSNVLRETFIDMNLVKLEFIDCNLNYVRFDAFKNCTVPHMKMSNSKLNFVGTNGLIIRKAKTVVFEDNIIRTLNTDAICINMQKHGKNTSFSFKSNEVGRLNKEAFNIKAAETIHFRKNIFKHVQGDAFKAIEFSSNFTFEDNEIKSRDKNLLKTLRPSVVNKLKLGDKCSCQYLESIKKELIEKRNEIADKNDIADNMTQISLKAIERNENTIADNMTQILLKAIECHDGPYISLAEYESKSCKDNPWNYTLPLIVVALILFLALISVIFILRCRTIQLRKKQKRTEKLQEQITTLHLHGPSIWGKRQRIEEEEQKMNTMAYPDLLLTTDAEVTYRPHERLSCSDPTTSIFVLNQPKTCTSD